MEKGKQIKEKEKIMNDITFFKTLLLKEMDEKKLSSKQKKIAKLDPPSNKLDAGDFEKLRSMKKEINTPSTPTDYSGNVVRGINPIVDMEEGEDHEVSMAHNSLKSIVSSASQLMNLLGNDEKDIPAWIQDHITNAENFISQASKNYHEYNEGSTGEHDMNELPDGTEEFPVEEMSLQSMMEDLLEAKKKKPSAGLTKKQKSNIVKKAKAGKDMGKKGKGFEKIVKAAEKSGARDPKAVAGAAFWKGQAKKAK